MKKHALILGLIVLMLPVVAQNNAAWLRYPSISPDGTQIVFSYKGDLYKVPSAGGTATPLTIHGAHDFMPVWSPDGKQIAFASDRFGNFDVYIMPANGGTAQRLTYHSANDYPWDFTPNGESVVYSSGRNDINTSVRFPNSTLWNKLYSVPTKGGRNILISSAGFQNAHFNKEGNQIIFQDRKGYEDEWRKHHTSSVTRDIWIYDMNSETYTKVSDFEGEDREPIFAPNDNNSFYYLSEKNGDQNIFKRTLSDNPTENQLTTFEHHPVRHLSVADNHTLCFSWNGDIYTLKKGGEPTKITVTTPFDFTGNEEEIVSVSSGASEMALSPNGKEIAFIFRGEVFVTSVEGKSTKRITNSPVQERMLSWHPDGRTLYYSKEQGESWDIYKASIERSEEPYFFASTLIAEQSVIATDKEEFQPVVSPNGKEIAYLEDRNTVKIFNLESKTSRTIVPAGQNFSYRDGDQNFIWSLDSKWLVARSSMGFYGSSYLVAFDVQNPGEGKKLTNSGFSDGGPLWAMDGKAMLWVNDKDGKKPLAYQGSREVDIYAMFFDKEAYDRFKLSKEEFDLLTEQEKKEQNKDEDKEAETDKKKRKKKKDDKENPELPSWNPDFDNVADWKVKLTPGSINLASYKISPKGDMLYFMARFEKGYDIWKLNTRTRELKTLAKIGSRGGSMEMSEDGKSLFVLSSGRIQKIDTKTGKVKPIGISAEMVVDAAAEREYIFHHAWKQVKHKFYDPNLHGIDWDMYRKSYARFLPHINNNYDFQELLSELLGELNGSHTGGRYYHRSKNGDATASLGLFYDEKVGGNGLKITEVIKGGPLDKADSKIKAGNIIEKIDGKTISNQIDWNKLLNRKVDNNVLLSILDPTTSKRWDEIVKPISIRAENRLLYKRWVETMRKMTEELSGGRVGYVHVQGMNDYSFRTVYDEVKGKNAEKEALIVDTRYNGGGWLHEDLSTFLNGKPYATFKPYGFKTKGGEPLDKWSKPSAVLMSEGNYSDAHLFPYAYRAKEIGKLIGMPVPGTGTAVWWESQIDPTIIFGIPMIAVCGIKEDRPLENLQLEPDVKVESPFEKVLNGEDLQLEKAVEELLKEI